MTDIPKTRASILDEARALITGPRAEAYGDAEDMWGRVAAIWSVRVGADITPSLACSMMENLKQVRADMGAFDLDNWRDRCGYAALSAEMAEREARLNARIWEMFEQVAGKADAPDPVADPADPVAEPGDQGTDPAPEPAPDIRQPVAESLRLEVIRLFDRGVPAPDIVKMLPSLNPADVIRVTLEHIRRSRGAASKSVVAPRKAESDPKVEPEVVGRPWTDAEKAEVWRRRSDGEAVPAIAASMGRPYKQVSNFIVNVKGGRARVPKVAAAGKPRTDAESAYPEPDGGGRALVVAAPAGATEVVPRRPPATLNGIREKRLEDMAQREREAAVMRSLSA